MSANRDDDDDAGEYYHSVLKSYAEKEKMLWFGINSDIHAEQIRQTIKEDAATYKELGYDVSCQMAADGDTAKLVVRHPKSRPSTPARVAMLKGAACGTIQRTLWGGSK